MVGHDTVTSLRFGMSQLLVHHFLAELDRLRKISGTSRETVVREAFKELLKAWGKTHELQFIAEYRIVTAAKNQISVDGALLHSLRVPFGYWEAKDEADDLDAEIEKKFRKGYPRDNIIFEDSTAAVLIQNGDEIFRCKVDDPKALEKLLNLFFGYERPEIADFRKAVAQFKIDLPAVLSALRAMIDRAETENTAFHDAQRKFLKHAQDTINPAITAADVREMLIQHILTEDIFAKVFNDSDFHRQNNVAKALYALEEKFFTGATKRNTLRSLEPYYAAILATAALISTHSEKQAFLKVIYENFYKIYNPKAADRLGVIYTPNEIVRFMIESADWLCEKHFGTNLIDEGVEILDPATGTGTFICELLEHFRGQPQKLWHKYKEELHANEVAILPYYVANLNIEATYAAIAGQYAEFPNLCFVDTLDNVAGLGKFSGHQEDLFGAVSEENVERIKRQNKRTISVIIGNPPYNANQQNENDNNKNRTYPRIDERIKATYIKESTAQKTKLYDMYARFFRWASDRLKDDGIIAFVSNRSFIDSRTFDGFRKVVARDFSEIHVVDLGGDVRANPKLSGTKHNVFGIQTGVAISFMVLRKGATGCRIHYARRPEMETADDKLTYLSTARVAGIQFDAVRPDAKDNWINQTNNDFESFIPVASKETKAAKTEGREGAIFKLFSLGVVTNRDDWVYDDSPTELSRKVKYLIEAYNQDRERLRLLRQSDKLAAELDTSIKWTRAVKRDLRNDVPYVLDHSAHVTSMYRPFVKRILYFSRQLNEMLYQVPLLFGAMAGENIGIAYVAEERAAFGLIAVRDTPNKDMFMPSAAQVLPRYVFETPDQRLDNITDWALDQFRSHYQGGARPSPLAGEGVPASAGTDEGAAAGEASPSSAPSWHLLPQGEKGDSGHLLPRGEKGKAKLIGYARDMRKSPTEAEAALWKLLRNRRFSDFKFRRQVPIGDYIVDFVCFEARLIVEADGSQHAESARDVRRDAWLEAEGYRIRRFWNADILNRREEVTETLWHDLNAPSSGPSHLPSPLGGRPPSPLAGEGVPASAGTDEGAAAGVGTPSSGPSGHLLPQGEKGDAPSPGRFAAPLSPEGEGEITKDDIFHYVYAVLHDPVYREKYAQNLKREFPRIPFYPNFRQWAVWGKALMDLHIGYESVEPWPLTRTDAKDEKAATAGFAPRCILKADKDHGLVVLDSETQLSGVPKEAWNYRLGNRSALEWILDQYKEKTPKDPTIREKFNTYRFADYKEKVVDLLARVTRVSVETQEIVAAMWISERRS